MIFKIFSKKNTGRIEKLVIGLLLLVLLLLLCGCRSYDRKIDVAYFFKTAPEKAVLDFLYCLGNKDPDYIYSNLIPESDRNSISREKYVQEFMEILNDINYIEVTDTVYLGYEENMSKVVAEFTINYNNGDEKQYKKYFYLIEENNGWKIIFEKTFI